jgi:osmotically-inducible protein OsmY
MPTATARRADTDIQRDIAAELAWDPRIQPNNVEVTVADGVATLTGWVDAYTKKWAAEQAALRVRGVRAVANEIEVRLTAADRRADPDIAAAAVQTLTLAVPVPTSNIKVTVSDGLVTLRGEVDWPHQREDAEQAVAGLPGVRGVVNLLTVRRTARPESNELKQRIADALLRSAETDAERITVVLEGDKVLLAGVVRSFAEKREAERIAWSGPGIQSVENAIAVDSFLD